MEGRLHGSARTTPRIRAELQESKESNRQLAARYRLNVKTVAKWRLRSTTIERSRLSTVELIDPALELMREILADASQAPCVEIKVIQRDNITSKK